MLGGAEARDVAEAFWADPSEESFKAYQRVCMPLYTQRPQPPEVAARITRNLDVAAHFRHTGGKCCSTIAIDSMRSGVLSS